MNRLTTERRTRVIQALVEGNSVRATCRFDRHGEGHGLEATGRDWRRLLPAPRPHGAEYQGPQDSMRRDLVLLPREGPECPRPAGREAGCWRSVDVGGARRG